MKPTTTPSAKADASEAIGRSDIDVLDMVFLFAQGFAEFVQRGLDLIGEGLGTAP